MDNYSINKGEEIRALIEGAGVILIYLFTYSPEFNLIGKCWSKIKSIPRQIGSRTYPDLVQAIEFAFNEVS
jgi:transposase